MKKFILALLIFGAFSQPSLAFERPDCLNFSLSRDEKAVKKVLKSQIKYANRMNYEKFMSTFDENYLNADGFNLETYSKLVKDIWGTYKKLKYGIEIKDITVTNDTAVINVIETSSAKLPVNEVYDGILDSVAESTYYLKKHDKVWKVYSDSVKDETTSMLYGDAKNLEIKLSAPLTVEAGQEYCATLEFEPPEDTMAIASIASDIVEYPQKPTQEVFRALPDDCILERLFTANSQNANEYIVASIGLTKADVQDLSIKLSLTGFCYKIKRVNVIKTNNKDIDVKI